MTEATRNALVRIDQILHEAGWDQVPSPPTDADRSVDLSRLRKAHESLLHQDHVDFLSAILGEPTTVEQFAEKMTAGEGGKRLRDTLRRVRDFVDSCEDVASENAYDSSVANR